MNTYFFRKQSYLIHLLQWLVCLVLLIDGSYSANAQCTASGFTVSGTNGTCASNGIINVTIPGASTCSGWVANLVRAGVPGVYASNPVSATGNSSFTNLPAGDYSVTLVNGAQSFGPQNVILTTAYQQLAYTTALATPGCQDKDAPLYTPNAEITLTIAPGTGLAPYTYSCTAPSYPTQSSGSTSATTYTFTALPSGETADITVTDACGSSVTTNVAIGNVPTILPLMDGEWGGVGYMWKDCATDGSCSYQYTHVVYSSNSEASIAAHSYYSVNGGASQPLAGGSWHWYTNSGIQYGDQIDITYSNGCYDTTFTKILPAAEPDLSPGVYNWTNLDTSCDTAYAVRLVFFYGLSNIGNVSYLCGVNNTVRIEYETTPGVWIPDGVYNNIGVSPDVNFVTTLELNHGTGNYRFISSDNCYLDTVEYNMPAYVSPAADFQVNKDISILEGTGGIWYGYANKGLTLPTTVSFSPASGAANTTLVAADPGIPGNLAGTYTISWPYVTSFNSNGWILLQDFPSETYNVTMTDACGRSATKQITLDTTRYDFEYSVVSGCNSSTVSFDFNVVNRGITTDGSLALFHNNGGVAGAPVSGTSFANGNINDNTIYNVPFGDYFIGFSRHNLRFVYWPSVILGGATGDAWVYQPITIDSVRSVSIDTEPFFCNPSDVNSGAVAVTLEQDTGLFPITYELYSSSDLTTPLNSYTTPDSSGLNHIFTGLTQGDYVVIASDLCSEFTSTVSVNSSAVAYLISASDTIVCSGSPDIDLWVALDTAVFDISWFDPLMQPVGTGDSVTVAAGTFPTGTIMYTAEYVPNASTGCVNPPVQSITISIDVIENPDLSISVSDIDLCNDIVYEVTINNTLANYTYELLDASGNSFTPPIFSTGNGGDLILQYPPSFTPVAGMVLPVVIYNASNTGCGGTLSDSVHVEKQVSNLDLTVTGSTVACPLDQGLISVLNSQNGITYTVIDAVPVDLNSGVGTGDSIGIVIPVNGLVGTYSYQVVASGMNCLTDTLNQSAQVTIIDTTAPSAICQDLTIYLDDMGEAVITASMLDGGSSDACGAVTLSASVLNFDCSAIGANTVTLTVTDESGNSSMCTSVVTVMDTISPSILSCQADTTLQLGMNCDVLLPDFTGSSDLEVTDNCSTLQSGLIVSQTPAAGTLINGSTQVILTISDDSGNSSFCVFMVDVSDTISPVITSCIDNQEQFVNEYCEAQVADYTYTDGFTVTDNCSAQGVDMVISQVPAPGTVITSDTVVWLYAMDQGGNVDSCSFVLSLSPCDIIIYESFSPNGDNQNEYFYVENLEFFPNTSVVIFNRWGTEVYQSDDYQNDWDGRSQSQYNIAGDKLPEGTYFYVLQLGMNGNTEVNNGKKYNGYVYLKK